MATLESIEAVLGLTQETLHNLCEQVKTANGNIATIKQKCFDRGVKLDGFNKSLYGEDGLSGVVGKQIKVMQELEMNRSAKTTAAERFWRFFDRVASTLVVAAIITLLYMWKTAGT